MGIGLSITSTFTIPKPFDAWVGLSLVSDQSVALPHDRFQSLYKVSAAWERGEHNHALAILDAELRTVDH